VACLNQWDQQSHRLFSTDGVMQTLYSGENAGGNTVGVLIRKKTKNMVCTREFALEEVEKHITNAIHWSII